MNEKEWIQLSLSRRLPIRPFRLWELLIDEAFIYKNIVILKSLTRLSRVFCLHWSQSTYSCEESITEFWIKLSLPSSTSPNWFPWTWWKHYSWSLFWFLLITEGAPSRLQRNSSVAFHNHSFVIPTIFEKDFRRIQN